MAAAVLDLFPGTAIGIGPATDEGFYYDFDFRNGSRPVEADLRRIEARMREIVRAAPAFVKEEVPKATAVELFRKFDQPYKVQLVEEKVTDGTARLYRTGDFVDLCLGPHLHDAGQLGAFRLLSLAGAYWKGSEKNPMLTRIYGTAFPTEAELEAHLKRLEEAAQRDHRKIGKELDLFMIDDMAGRGLPLWLPKGATVRRLLEEYIVRKELRAGYQHVRTTDIARLDLYKQSGHWARYREAMYPPSKIEDEEWQLRPMNCPHHIRIFQRRAYSYRDLPGRLAELGTVYRYAKSGEVSGLIRVRAFTINDAHIFCRPDQVTQEFDAVVRLILEVYEALGVTDFYFRLSLRDQSSDKWMGDPAVWEMAQDAARAALRAGGHKFVEAPGEAAFYGPKLDVQIKDAIGREFSLSTNQIDFLMPEAFGLEYTDADQTQKRPVMIHRAPIGSFERFMAYMIELYAGAFPLWLAPVQVVFIPIADRHLAGVEAIAARFRDQDLRVEVDGRTRDGGQEALAVEAFLDRLRRESKPPSI